MAKLQRAFERFMEEDVEHGHTLKYTELSRERYGDWAFFLSAAVSALNVARELRPLRRPT